MVTVKGHVLNSKATVKGQVTYLKINSKVTVKVLKFQMSQSRSHFKVKVSV